MYVVRNRKESKDERDESEKNRLDGNSFQRPNYLLLPVHKSEIHIWLNILGMIKHFGWRVIVNPKLCICFVDQHHCSFKHIAWIGMFLQEFQSNVLTQFLFRNIWYHQIAFGMFCTSKKLFPSLVVKRKYVQKLLTAASAGLSSWKGEKQLVQVFFFKLVKHKMLLLVQDF